MTPAQCRAARALAGLSQSQLADAAGVVKSVVWEFENGKRATSPESIVAMRAALETLGVSLLDEGAPSLAGGEGARRSVPAKPANSRKVRAKANKTD